MTTRYCSPEPPFLEEVQDQTTIMNRIKTLGDQIAPIVKWRKYINEIYLPNVAVRTCVSPDLKFPPESDENVEIPYSIILEHYPILLTHIILKKIW